MHHDGRLHGAGHHEPVHPAPMRGIQSVCEAQGYDVIAVNTDGVPDREDIS